MSKNRKWVTIKVTGCQRLIVRRNNWMFGYDQEPEEASAAEMEALLKMQQRKARGLRKEERIE